MPDTIWDEAARHYDEPALAALVIAIATVNVWHRLNVTTRQPAGRELELKRHARRSARAVNPPGAAPA